MPAYPTLPAWDQPAPEWLSLQQAASIYGVSVDPSTAASPRASSPRHASASGSSGCAPRTSTGCTGGSHRRPTREVAPILTGCNWCTSTVAERHSQRARSISVCATEEYLWHDMD
jgi:hypothetical protein